MTASNACSAKDEILAPIHGGVRFPVVSLQGLSLETVQCIASMRERSKKSFVIHGPNPDVIENTLGEARSTELGEHCSESVNVRFIPNQFSDNSYSLALAIADKWARNHWPNMADDCLVFSTGLIASGGAGSVQSVDYFEEKIQYLLSLAPVNSRIVVSKENMDRLPAAEQNQIKQDAVEQQLELFVIDHVVALDHFWGNPDQCDQAREDKIVAHSTRPTWHVMKLGRILAVLLVLSAVWPSFNGWFSSANVSGQRIQVFHDKLDQFENNSSHTSSNQLKQALLNLQAAEAKQLGDHGIDLSALLFRAESRLQQIALQKIAVEYYWELYRLEPTAELQDSVRQKLVLAAEDLGRENWSLLIEDIRRELQR